MGSPLWTMITQATYRELTSFILPGRVEFASFELASSWIQCHSNSLGISCWADDCGSLTLRLGMSVDCFLPWQFACSLWILCPEDSSRLILPSSEFNVLCLQKQSLNFKSWDLIKGIFFYFGGVSWLTIWREVSHVCHRGFVSCFLSPGGIISPSS